MFEGIQSDYVSSTIGGTFRPSDSRPGKRINQVEAELESLGVLQCCQHGKHADTIGDEVWRVFGADHALAQRAGQKGFQDINGMSIGAGVRNQLDQMHITRWIEKVHSAKACLQGWRQSLGQLGDAQARSVGHKIRCFGNIRRDLAVQIGFPVGPLGNRLDDQIALAQQGQMLLIIGRCNKLRPFGQGQRCRFQLAEIFKREFNRGVQVSTVLRGQVK